MANQHFTMASPTVKPVLEYVNSRKGGCNVEQIADAIKVSAHHAASTARYLAQKRKIAVIRKQGDSSYTYLPMAEVGEDYVPALRSSKGMGSRAKAPSPGKNDGAFALLQIAGKMIEFESMDELRRFIEAWGAQS